MAGKEYIDFFMCHGAVLLGHNRPEVKQSLIKSLDKGYFAGYDSEETIRFAKKVCSIIPSAQALRFVNSGTEGTLLSLRLARGFTGKDIIIRIDGHFHGIHDYLIANNLIHKRDRTNDGSRASKVVGRSAGIPSAVDPTIITVPWNNAEIIEHVLKEQGERVAGIIMNIIDYNNGLFLTSKAYLEKVRALCNTYGTVLIFDEILSGFKTGLSCAQGYYGVTPDICTLGKSLTNDVPLGIVVGKKKIMDKIMDPVDPVISGGTFSGNQLGIAAGNAVLDILMDPDFYPEYIERVEQFYTDLQEVFTGRSFPAAAYGLGAGFTISVGTDKPLKNYDDADRIDTQLAKKFFSACIDKGLYFHTDFTVSAAHDRKTLDEALERFDSAVKTVQRG
jgi:glutamate-1-semialdehyde 2,1-aminomutase